MTVMGEVGKHSQMKHRLLGMYLSICSRFVKSQRSHDFIVVDLYASDGKAYWPGGDEKWEGSAQIASKWVSRAGKRSFCILTVLRKVTVKEAKIVQFEDN